MKKQDLVNYLDDFLNIKLFTDKSKNGLQVDNNKSEVKKIGYSVDASTYIFEKAKNENIDLVLCHHGMYWGFESTLVGIPFKRAKLLIDNDIALYACHLPLDAHREVGNNMGLLKGFVNIFGLRDGEYRVEPFGEYNGNTIGFGLRFDNKIHISSLQTLFAETLQLQKNYTILQIMIL
ncbi:hypothetical protein EOM39_00785 [Candidatus Gracilibacteria bacterium]|nr:hypothetical protein [Candidatus Gracilibacteria bacterium]